MTGSQSRFVQGNYLSMKYFVQLFVCMDVSFLSIMYVYYEHVYLYMCVIHCRNGCTDMLYYCVIFVILNKKH